MPPTSEHERFEFLDVLRGCALFGIITANMVSYSLYLYLPESAKASMHTYSADRVLDFVELFLIEGKLYTIFSVLFGVGFSILLTRAQAKELVFHRLLRIGSFKGRFGVREPHGPNRNRADLAAGTDLLCDI